MNTRALIRELEEAELVENLRTVRESKERQEITEADVDRGIALAFGRAVPAPVEGELDREIREAFGNRPKPTTATETNKDTNTAESGELDGLLAEAFRRPTTNNREAH